MKKYITLFILAVCVLFGLSACVQPASVYGKFKQESYTLNLGDVLDLSQELSLTGTTLEEVSIKFSNEGILSLSENRLTATKSGSTLVLVKSEKETIASCLVSVNFKFAYPQNLSISSEGELSWEESFISNGDEIVKAQGYTVYIDNTRQYQVSTNSFSFASNDLDFGRYQVSIQALANEEQNVLASEKSPTQTIVYDFVSVVEGLNIQVSQRYLDEQATLSWNHTQNAVYDVIINDFKVNQKPLSTSSLTYDFSRFANGREITVQIVAKDAFDQLMQTTSSYKLQKLLATNPSYRYNGSDGYLVVNDNANDAQNVNGYILYWSSLDGKISGQKVIQSGQREQLDHLGAGIYNISLQTLGGKANGGLYLNSASGQSFTFAKLSMPQPELIYDGQSVTINLSEGDNGYVRTYKIVVGQKEKIVKLDQTNQVVFSASDFFEGQNLIEIYALPSAQESSDTGVAYFTEGKIRTNRVINSDSFVQNVYLLSDISSISHAFDEENKNLSVLTFENVQFADSFKLFINDEQIEDFTFDIGTHNTVIKFENLKDIAPNEDNAYQITIEAFREDGLSINSYGYKVLNILDVPTTAPAENGQYSWNKIEGAVYQYSIYKTDSTGETAEFYLTENTEQTCLKEALPFGYWAIQVVAKSSDTNVYLDSDFALSSKILEDNFLVYEQINSPQVKFIDNQGQYSIEISNVEYASHYAIFLDGQEIDSFDNLQDQESYTRKLIGQDFSQEKTYILTVKASAGNRFDSALHTESEPSQIEIVRICQPSYQIEEEYDSFALFGIEGEYGKKISENFAVSSGLDDIYVDHFDILVNGEKANKDNQAQINLIDRGESFTISISAIAKAQEGNSYYLNSAPTIITVNRLASPKNLTFENGKLLLADSNGNTQKYFVEIELQVASGTRMIRFFTQDSNQTFNLQDKIDQLLTNQSFANEFAQASGIKVKAYAYVKPYTEDGILYLQSAPATTQTAQTELSIDKLASTSLSFDVFDSQKLLSWEAVATGTVYDIYNGNDLVKKDYTATSVYLDQVLNGKDLTKENMIFSIVAKNSSYLNSSSSNKVTIAKLSALQQATLVNDNGNWQVALNITKASDVGRIAKVLVNNEEIDYLTGSSTITIDLSTFEEKTFALTIQFIASNTENAQVYYVNSDTFTLSLTDISENLLNGEISNNQIVWQSPYQNWQSEVVYYDITISVNGTVFEIKSYEKTSISLDELEALTNAVFDSGQVSILITSSLYPCVVELPGNVSFGKAQQSFSTEKVQEVENGKISVELGPSKDLIEKELDSIVKIDFENIWKGEAVFDVYVNSTSQPVFENLKPSASYADCSITLSGTTFTLSVSSKLLTEEGENKIYLRAKQQNKIISDLTEFTISRNSNIASADLSAYGNLKVTLGQYREDTLLLKLSITSQTIKYESYQITSQVQEIDISSFIEGISGLVELELLVIDSDHSMLSSLSSTKISKNKLAPISEIETSLVGQLTFHLTSSAMGDSNIEFVVQSENGRYYSFKPAKDSDNDFTYTYSLQGIVNVLGIKQEGTYQIAFANRLSGSLNSDFVDYQLRFKLEENGTVFKYRQNQTADYIIIKELAPETNLTTSGLRISIMLYDKSAGSIISPINDERLIAGYWDANSNSFKQASPNYGDERDQNVYPSYALNINSLLEKWPSGSFTVNICRVAHENDSIYIYQTKTFSFRKLNVISGEDIANSAISWTWSQGNTPEGTTPSSYIISIWATEAEENVQRITTTSFKYDLRQIALASGQYSITIQAISQNEDVVASDLSEIFTAQKYAQTKGVTLENGRIVFDINNSSGDIDKELDLVQVFYSKVNNDLAENFVDIGNAGFDDIFTFKTNTVHDQTVKLIFEETDSKGQTSTGKKYVATVNPMNLLLNFEVISTEGKTTFLQRLDDYITSGGNASQEIFRSLQNFYNHIKDMAQGISDGKIIFDDFGKTIPNGFYKVSVVQTASDPSDDFIDSDPSVEKLIYVSASPTMTLFNTYDEEKGKEIYNASYQVREIVDNNGDLKLATDYIMLFRSQKNQENIYRFELSYGNSSWSMYNGEDRLEGVISGDQNTFTINFTALGEITKGEEYLIDKTNQYYVYIYAVGNNNSCYGKSEQLDLIFLSIEQNNLNFADGVFTITTSGNEIGSDILIRYRRQYTSGDEIQEEIIQAEADNYGRVVLNDYLTVAGRYDYVIFNVMGQTNNVRNILKLPSVSYGILNLYKLNVPTLTTTSNTLQISANSSDSGHGPFKYQLQNNALKLNITSTAEFYGKEGFNQLKFAHNENDISGLNYVKFLPSTSLGSQFEIEDYKGVVYQFEKVINNNIVLASNTSSISVETLPAVENLKIQSGNLVWDEVELKTKLADKVEIVYKVVVEYLDDSQSFDKREFFTLNNHFDTAEIDYISTQGDGRYFNFTVYVYAGTLSEGGTELIEGGFIDIASPVSFNNKAHVLFSAPTTLKHVSKQNMPEFALDEQVYDGKFAIKRTQENLRFAIELTWSSGQTEILNSTAYTVKTGQIGEGEDKVDVYFIEIVSQSYAKPTSFSIKIYAYTPTAIKSDPLSSKSVYKLPAVTKSDVALGFDTVSQINSLSLKSYFDNNKYSFANDMYEIVVDCSMPTVLNSANMMISNANLLVDQTVTMTVKAKSGTTNLLTSQPYSISITQFVQPTDEENNPMVEFIVDRENVRLVWNIRHSQDYDVSQDYEFIIKLTYENGVTETQVIKNYEQISTEEEQYKQYYYQPKVQNLIVKVEIYGREIFTTDMLELYGTISISIDNPIDFRLFASGLGTAEDPYIIENGDNFTNIKTRDNPDETVYFALNKDIEFTLDDEDFFLENFYGSLDGNGHTITVNFAKENFENVTIDKKISTEEDHSIAFNFSQSLIKTINKGAIVKNMNIAISHDLTGAKGTENTQPTEEKQNYKPTVLSGLATENFGTVSSVSLVKLESTFGKSISSLAIGGLIAFNSGIVEDSQNMVKSSHDAEEDSPNDSIIIETQNSSTLNLMFGAIVLKNESGGQIIGAQNNRNISISVRREGQNIYVGGIVYENNGSVIASGNNASISASGNSAFNSRIGGVVGYNNGTVSHIFNGGSVSSTQSSGSAGLIYYYRGGQVDTLFELTGSTIITSIYGGSVNQKGKIYGSGDTSSFTITALSELVDGQTFATGLYTIIVEKNANNYNAILSKKVA